MNHAGEITPLRGWCGRMSPSSPRSRRCISAISLGRGHRRCQGRDLSRPGARRRRRHQRATTPISRCCASARRIRRADRQASATPTRPRFGCCGVELGPKGSEVSADMLGETLRYRLGAPGEHFVQNSLAVLAAAERAGADCDARPAGARASLRASRAAARARCSSAPDGRIALIDESYNANPASMRAALARLARHAAPGVRPPRRGARRHAGTRPRRPPTCIAGWPEFIDGAGVDLVFACGELMGSLYEALPASRRGAYAKTADGA